MARRACSASRPNADASQAQAVLPAKGQSVISSNKSHGFKVLVLVVVLGTTTCDTDYPRRCRRLGKDCQPSEAARRRNAHHASASDTRIAQLEAKIEALSSAVQSAIGSSGSRTAISHLLSRDAVSDPTPPSSVATPLTNSTSIASSHTGDGRTPASAAPDVSPTDSEAEEALSFFRSQMLPYFPFLSLAPALTASQLRQDRPVLLQAIVTVATFSTRRRLPLIEELKRLVFGSALMHAQSSMDLLLGVLTYIAWSTDAFLGRAALLSRFMVLAISLVYDLRLFKPSRPDVQAVVAYTQGFPDSYRAGDETVHGFMERQRALLACFVLSSQ